MARPLPRLFVIRHGETEWSLNGRHTGTSDIPLTARGEEQMRSKAKILVGPGQVIDPKNLCTVLVSPRQRAHRTFHLLFEHISEKPDHAITEEVREWDYGEYEGLVSSEIKERNPTWSIWMDGCPGGESVDDMTRRVDNIIAKVREYHRQYKEEGLNTRDVLIVAHGHFNRCLISRWINFPLCLGTHFNVEPGGVAVLSYNHHSLSEPALNALNLYATSGKGHPMRHPSTVSQSVMAQVQSFFPSRRDMTGADVAAPEAHGEHEAARPGQDVLDNAGNEAEPEGDTGHQAKNSEPAAEDISADAAPEGTTVATKQPDGTTLKPGAAANTKAGKLLVKTAEGKSNGGPPTPLVKRIIKSGTFGAGTIKSTASKAAAPPKSTAPPASPIKKASSAPSSKPAMVPKLASSISSTLFGNASSRRASMAPKTPAAPAPKPSLSSSTSAKPSSAPAVTTGSPARTNTVSPTSSASRPRATVTEGVKKAPTSGRQSLPAIIKSPTGLAKLSVPSARAARATGSISSIKEIKEDGKALEELKNALDDASTSLAAKTATVTGLETQISTLNASLEAAVTEEKTQRLAAERLGQEKAASETRLKEATEALEQIRADLQESSSDLKAIRFELETTKATTALQTELAQSSISQIEQLEAEVKAAKNNLGILRAANEAAAVEAAAAAIEHEALIKAKADFDAIHAETRALKIAHDQALEAANAKLKDLESKAARVDELEVGLGELKREREESASKISELEVEILELKESQDASEDDRKRILQRVEELEGELSKAASATQQAIEEAQAKEADSARTVQDLKANHQDDLRSAADAHTAVVVRLEALQVELSSAQAAHEQTRVSTEAAAEAHAQRLKELETIHLDRERELSEEIMRFTAELKSQEAQYSAKVDAVKMEHDRLLQEAFERAKNEAGAAHSVELQDLRARSEATIEQLCSAHESTIETLKAEHQAILEEQIKGLEKRLDNQSLDLKATREDLSKAKMALEIAQSEDVTIRSQLDEARTAADAAAEATPKYLATIDRLNEELGSAKRELASLTELLNLTKASLSDISQSHQNDLEEAVARRVEDITKLRAVHDEEVKTLATQKSELSMRLSDLESELATLKTSVATAEALAVSAPKSNGNVAHASPVITKEELQQLHEAHNLKLHDVEAEHNRQMKALREELDTALKTANEMQQDVSRRAMEIQYLEQEQDENHDQITRLKSDVEHLSEQLKAKEQPVDG